MQDLINQEIQLGDIVAKGHKSSIELLLVTRICPKTLQGFVKEGASIARRDFVKVPIEAVPVEQIIPLLKNYARSLYRDPSRESISIEASLYAIIETGALSDIREFWDVYNRIASVTSLRSY